MPEPSRSQSRRGSYILGAILVAATAIRAVPHYSGTQNLIPAIVLAGLFAIYYGGEPLLSRFRWHKFIYFPVQTGLVIAASSLLPYLDLTVVLYIVLSLQLTHHFSRRVALSGFIAYSILLTVTQILGVGLLAGLGVSMLMIAIGVFMVSGDMLYRQVQADQEDSQAMLARLQEAHKQLQEYAARAEELAVARERNRLARELHDTVSQMIFSITLVARSTQLILEREPSQVSGQLDRLQEMTGAALGQLRSLITQMRPPQ